MVVVGVNPVLHADHNSLEFPKRDELVSAAYRQETVTGWRRAPA